METNINEIQNKDDVVWKIEKQRAAFKFYLFVYIVVNIFYGQFGISAFQTI